MSLGRRRGRGVVSGPVGVAGVEWGEGTEGRGEGTPFCSALVWWYLSLPLSLPSALGLLSPSCPVRVW